MSGALCAALTALCGELRPALTPASADRVGQVADRLSGPLRLAVAGRIKSGKSTVVNALIGRRVAPTDVRECTRLVTRFRYGTVDRVEVVRTDGGRTTLPYDDTGQVPADLGVDPAGIAYLDAFLTSAMLRSMTVIDTPGLGSLDRSGGSGLDSGSRTAIARAEALLFVLTQTTRADDAEALSAFGALANLATPGTGSPVNAVAVLNKADQIEPGPGDGSAGDPMAAGAEVAAVAAGALRHRVFDVLPLVGLVAEATGTGDFTEADAQALRRIAAVDPSHRDLLFFSTDLFVRADVGVPAPARARLLERLDLYGVRRAVELIQARPATTTGELRRTLMDISGFPPVRDAVEGAFGRRADGIKAAVALAALDAVAARAPVPSDRVRIRDAVERLLQQPWAHQLRLFEAASLVASGAVPLPAEMAAELSCLAGTDDPAGQLGVVGSDPGVEVLRQMALERAARWRSFATFGSTPAQSRVAHVGHRGFFLLWQRLDPTPSGGAR
ncbi:MAG TPA: dynamin family protein [Mycobacteriales bacterium]|nr:dynamin family protein [Mycobacteriales bacterium]